MPELHREKSGSGLEFRQGHAQRGPPGHEPIVIRRSGLEGGRQTTVSEATIVEWHWEED